LPSSRVSEGGIRSELETKYRVDDYFYPNISFELEVPGGLTGEARRIRRDLRHAGIKTTTPNIYHTLSVKRSLIRRLRNSKRISLYRRYIAKRVRPVGAVVPVEYVYATIVLLIALFFLKSFAEEAGRISARTLLGRHNDREISGKIRCSVPEVRLARPDAVVAFYDLKRRLSRRRKRRTPRLLVG